MKQAELIMITLRWDDVDQDVRYTLCGVLSDGHVEVLGDFTQGPFDTSLEVAQWAWRTISKRLPPSRC